MTGNAMRAGLKGPLQLALGSREAILAQHVDSVARGERLDRDAIGLAFRRDIHLSACCVVLLACSRQLYARWTLPGVARSPVAPAPGLLA